MTTLPPRNRGVIAETKEVAKRKRLSEQLKSNIAKRRAVIRNTRHDSEPGVTTSSPSATDHDHG